MMNKLRVLILECTGAPWAKNPTPEEEEFEAPKLVEADGMQFTLITVCPYQITIRRPHDMPLSYSYRDFGEYLHFGGHPRAELYEGVYYRP